MHVLDEFRVLQRIAEQARITNHPGRRHISTMQESFQLDSAHGRHLCFVHQALGIFPALFDHDKKLPVPIVKHVLRQLLEVLDFLHSQCCIIHTGETLQPSGLFLTTRKISNLISRNNIDIDKLIDGGELAAAQATPKNHTTSPENAILSRPLTVFRPAELANLNQVPKFDVLLTDYGTGKRAAKKK